ncbi:hypothetical protein BROUX41_002238 [Berkeleyomyces rouxiae]|uniref:uncharacterized protein n=1 Tax=Berkeleyomyces rouxiae TaxID=2035830 RepID=UPI003B7CD736
MLPTTSFATLLAATGAMGAALLPRQEELACVQPSANFEKWTITDFDFHWSKKYTNPAHGIIDGVVQFNLTNPAIGNPLQCKGHSTVWPNFFSGDQWIDCEGTIVSSARFAFDNTASTLKINQAWLCDTSNYNHTGFGDAVLACTTSGIQQNPNWVEGSTELFSEEYFNCALSTFDIQSNTPNAYPTGPIQA